ncbi:MAG: flagellar type III secretion system pore protein FliP [Janthinobacterium lividum]
MKKFHRTFQAFIIFGLIYGSSDLHSQSLSLDMSSSGGSLTSKLVQMVGLISVLSLAPSILVMVTSFTRIVVVMSFLRTALGTQQSPPNTVLISLALFLTLFVMGPVLEKSYQEGLAPYMDEKISEEEAFQKTMSPLHKFMMAHVREKDLLLFVDLGKIQDIKKPEDTPLRVLIPAFMISELHRAFEIGFLIFLPFLVIDLVVASVLMAMGMMMLPPTSIALPFKLIFFVMVDGWHLTVGSLVKGFITS